MAQTFGEKLVRTKFNPSADDKVTKVKNTFAQLIDDVFHLVDMKRQDPNDYEIVDQRASADRDNKVLVRQGDELINLLETAAMLYVKVLTAPESQPDEV